MEKWKQEETRKSRTNRQKFIFQPKKKRTNIPALKKCQFFNLITCYFIREMYFRLKKQCTPRNICFAVIFERKRVEKVANQNAKESLKLRHVLISVSKKPSTKQSA